MESAGANEFGDEGAGGEFTVNIENIGQAHAR